MKICLLELKNSEDRKMNLLEISILGKIGDRSK